MTNKNTLKNRLILGAAAGALFACGAGGFASAQTAAAPAQRTRQAWRPQADSDAFERVNVPAK